MKSTRTLRPRSRSRHQPQSCCLLPSHLLCKLLLYQAKTLSPTFHPLSFNILREVCSYIGFIPSLAMTYSKRAYCLNISSPCWERVGPIPHDFERWGSDENAVMIGSLEVFVCGGASFRNGKAHLISKHTIIVNQDGGTEMMSMLLTASVYVFGGKVSEKVWQKSAERFSLVRGSWESIPDMHQ